MSADEGPHSFQYTPFGILPAGAQIPSIRFDEPAPAGKAMEAVASARPPTSPPPNPTHILMPVLPSPSTARFTIDPGQPLTGKQLMAGAKARIKEIDRQLRNVPALQSERAQLTALVLAATLPRRPRKTVQ